MDKHIAQITNKSVEQSGLPNDFKKALAEYIWNGFDAGATEVLLNFESNEIGYISSFSISDNGSGINIETIGDTFGHFLDSQKLLYSNKNSFVRGKKGKGRYAFSTFANACKWTTTYQGPDSKYLQYSITINKGELQSFETFDTIISKKKKTGTVVSFTDFFGLTGDLLLTKEFTDYLASEFGWFLYLNRAKDFKILINGTKLSYDEIIGHAESFNLPIGNYTFQIDFIRWNQRIGDKYYFYFLTDDQKEAFKKHTSFNNKAIDYHHSVYVKSSFFSDFHETADESPVLEFSGKNQTDPTFRALIKELTNIVSEQEKEFIRGTQADKLLNEYEATGILPYFNESELEQQHRQDLKDVIRELYCAEPRLFHGLNIQQRKAFAGILNILLATNQKGEVLNVLENITELSEEERGRVGMVLE